MRVTIAIVLLSCGGVAAQDPSHIGTINAVTGGVLSNGVPITLPGEHVAAGSEIRTGRGMAEVLLTPGNFLRIGDRSRVLVESLSPARATLQLRNGVAILESLSSTGTIAIDKGAVECVLRGPALVELDSRTHTVRVFSGNATLLSGEKRLLVEKGFEADTHNLKTERIRPRPVDPLYAWASYRSERLSSESAAVQPPDVPRDDAGKASWVKMPWSDSYTFISPSGYVNSPFGWPFYAPGHSHNHIPFPGSGDSYLYGPPIVPPAAPNFPTPHMDQLPTPTVPLTGPGIPSFPKNK